MNTINNKIISHYGNIIYIQYTSFIHYKISTLFGEMQLHTFCNQYVIYHSNACIYNSNIDAQHNRIYMIKQ